MPTGHSPLFRKVTGIDSIAQAAGRCNREGGNEEPQQVYVFDLPEASKCSFFRSAGQSSAKLFEPYSGNLTTPECVHEYFKDYFWKNEQNMDQGDILGICRTAQSLDVQFKEIAEFQMIDSAGVPVVIAIENDAVELVNALERAEHIGGLLRQLQQYCVQIYPYQIDEIKNWLEQPKPGVWVLRSKTLYSDTTGLQCKEPQGNAFFV